MQINELKPKYPKKDQKRIGRGGKRGTTSGRGTKGQTARSGSKKIRPAIYGLIKKFPKLRGWKMKGFYERPAIVSLKIVNENFKNNENINPKSLVARKLVDLVSGKIPSIKILGLAESTKKLNIFGVSVSKSVKTSIEKAGGKVGL
ncbi:uL15 family ribosomal protein [Candidatus Azambacteria bacterium]|nr:uL15 family ribosomal protein [Candidatus Azambacteria bacterium]